MRLYRKGIARPGCCWFESKEEAINWDGNNSESISRVIVIPGEFDLFFEPNGVGYRLSDDGFKYLKDRIEIYKIDEFLERCDDPIIGRFM